MHNTKLKLTLLTALLSGAFLVTACSQEGQTVPAAKLEVISAQDECHVCGMNISRFPGPKGQAILRRGNVPLKFCSSAELFSWLLQPDTQGVLHSAYVHDMGKAITWEQPNDEHFVEVKKAWYVVGHKKKGAMGPTLASFTTKQDAEAFLKESGGELVNYSDINLGLLMNLVSRK